MPHLAHFVDEARADPGVLRRLRGLLTEESMRLDSANRSFLTLMSFALLLGMYVLCGAVGSVLMPLLVGARLPGRDQWALE